MNEQILNGKAVEVVTPVNTMSMGDFAIAALLTEARNEASRLHDGGLHNGDFTVTVTINGRMDGLDKLVARIVVSHYHYQSFEGNTQSARGIEWDEVHEELRRRLTRDSSLKRIAHQKESPLA